MSVADNDVSGDESLSADEEESDAEALTEPDGASFEAEVRSGSVYLVCGGE